MTTVRIATRGSALALIQARLVAEALAVRNPGQEYLLEKITTEGDRHPSMRLFESPREGVFVKELERALLEGRADMAVHSAKDLPTVETAGLSLAAFLPRGRAGDVLVSTGGLGLMELGHGARVGTGSPRRAAQLRAARPDLVPVEIRGNVDTRLRRLADGEVDALVLAAAGLDRLGRLDHQVRDLPLDAMLPAPGQGALAVQVVEGSPAAELAARVDDADCRRAVIAERSLLRRLGGGCLSALGAYAAVAGTELSLRAVVLDSRGARVIRAESKGHPDGEVVARVADELERQGAGRLLNRLGPLDGLRVLVTRAESQEAGLSAALRGLGATVSSCPVIEIKPLEVDRGRLRQLASYDWLVLTSANGVDRLFGLLAEAGLELPTYIKVAAMGPETAARLRSHGKEPALVPEQFVAEELARRLVAQVKPGARILLARAAGSRDVLPQELRRAGASVDEIETYRADAPAGLPGRLREALAGVDLVTFTSSSTVRHFVEAAGPDIDRSLAVACIGPITAQTAAGCGLPVAIIAAEYTTRGLVDAIVRSRSQDTA